MNLDDPWDFFDKIYCISIDARPDRREQAKKQFARVGVLARVEFVIVGLHPENREKGIFASHRLCLQKGLKAGARRILVFEDDVVFRAFAPRILAEACAGLARRENWDGLFLGCITSGSRRTATPSLVGITYRCLAHAYALNAPFARRVVRQEWANIPFDELLRKHGDGFFAIRPMCAFQGNFTSDNQTVVIDALRRFFGGLAFIQWMNERYQNNKALFLAAPLAGFLALALLARALLR